MAGDPQADAVTTVRDAPNPPAAKKPLWRRILRKVGWVALGLVVVVALLVGFLHTGWGKDFVKGRAEKALSKRVTGTLSIDDLDYGFLFSDVELRGLTIVDADNRPAIELDRLYVDLDRGSLIDGAPILNDVTVEGVRVAIVKKADGTSNLTGLFVPSERKGRNITVEKLTVTDVAVRIERPDGSVTEISEVGLAGNLDINSIDRQYLAELTELGGAVTIERADGTKIVVPKVTTSATARVTADSANVVLRPIEVDATLTRPEHGTQTVPVRLGEVTVERAGGAIVAKTSDVRVGPLAIASLEADAKLEDRKMVGNQRIALDGLRVAHEELAALLGRPVLASDVAMNLSVEGPPEKLTVDGAIKTGGGDIGIAGTVDARDLDNPGYDVKVSGDKLVTSKILAGEDRPSLQSSLAISLRGDGIPRRPGSKARLELTTGPSQIAAKGKVGSLDTLKVIAEADGKAIVVEKLAVDALGLQIAASGELSEGRTVRGTVSIDGDAQRALVQLAGLGIRPSRRIPVPLPRKLDLDVTAHGNLDGAITLDIDRTTIPLAGGSVTVGGRAELGKQDGKRKLASADLGVTLRRLRIEKVARIAGRKTTLAGTLAGTVNVKLRGSMRDIRYDVVADLADPAVTVNARGQLGATRAKVDAEIEGRELGERIATVKATVPLTTRGGKRGLNTRGKVSVRADVAERTIAELKALVPPRIAAKLDERARAGKVSLEVAIDGTLNSPRGSIKVKGEAELQKLPGQTVALVLDAGLSPRAGGGVVIAPAGTVSVVGIDEPIVVIGGTVTTGTLFRRGKLDRKKLRAAVLGATVTIPERELASLAPLRPKLEGLPGNVALAVKTSGTPAAPEFEVNGGWTGYETATKEQGAVAIKATGTPNNITADIHLGADKQIAVNANVVRKPTTTSIVFTADADRSKLARLLPARADDTGARVDYGELEWKMKGDVVLRKTPEKLAIDKVDLNGYLDVDGTSLTVPGSKRRIKDIGLRVEAKQDIVRLAHLKATESDEQYKDRTVLVTAEASLKDGPPKAATATIRANKWLLFGGSMGKADAPRATLDADIDVEADLSGERPELDVTLNSLDFSEPDRFARDHGLENVAAFGDIMIKGRTDTPVGRLGPVREPSDAAPRKRRPMLVRLHIPKPIHAEKTPLDILVSGSMVVDITEDALVPTGKLKVHGGKVGLFGHVHTYESGSIEFDKDHPRGKLSLTFARRLHPATLRRLSAASGGDSVKLTIAGDAVKRKVILSGAGNAGMLEVMSVHQAGRSYYYTEPDLPASNTTQAPQLLQPLVLTFLATNLPHMLFLDRFSAWSDPYHAPGSYGRVEHFEGEHNMKSGKSRVRIVARPNTLGRSTTEVQLDRLFMNTARTALGVGIRAGSRLGGGAVLFFDWTSSD